MVVRGGIEPPTPRFSGAPNGSNLANAGESGVPGEPHAAPCCHDLKLLSVSSGDLGDVGLGQPGVDAGLEVGVAGEPALDA